MIARALLTCALTATLAAALTTTMLDEAAHDERSASVSRVEPPPRVADVAAAAVEARCQLLLDGPFPASTTTTPSEPHSDEVKRDEVPKQLSGWAQLATDARIVPKYDGARFVGVKLFSIRPGSFWGKLGVQNGDVITHVNGCAIASPDRMLELYERLKLASRLTLDIIRRGKPTTVDYPYDYPVRAGLSSAP